MNALALAISLPLVVLIFLGSKRVALLALAAGVLFLPQQQAVDVGITLTSTRVFEFAGLLRVALRHEFGDIRLNKIDKTFVLLYLYTTSVYLLRATGHQMEMVGAAVDAFCSYFVFRALAQTDVDLKWFLGAFLLLLVPYVCILSVESYTGQNPFAILGAGFFDIRDGRLRALASFRNSSSLGTLGASFLPLYIGIAIIGQRRLLGLLGVAMSCAVVYFSNSGGPASAALFGLLAWLAWPLRERMKQVRLVMALALICLGLVMKAPIWYLPARISDISGGGGWHRSRVLELAAERFGDWWLAGMDLSQTRQWFTYVLDATGSADITNNFLVFGLRGGAGSLVLLILLLVMAFSALGIVMRSRKKQPGNDIFLWSLGCMLVVHIASWFGISYFDQITVFWFMHLAAISSVFQQHLSAQEKSAARRTFGRQMNTLDHLRLRS